MSQEGTDYACALTEQGNNCEKCLQCLEKVEHSRRRDHVGQHILKAMRGIYEELKGQPVSSRLSTSKSLPNSDSVFRSS